MIDVKARHEYWWNYLLSQSVVPDNFDRTLPKIKYTTRLSRSAGTANLNSCEYNLNYIVQEGNKYDETICHELCHVLAKRIYPWTTHGALWHYFYNVVCRSERGRFNHYSAIVHKQDRTEEMKKVRELLKLQRKIAACEKA